MGKVKAQSVAVAQRSTVADKTSEINAANTLRQHRFVGLSMTIKRTILAALVAVMAVLGTTTAPASAAPAPEFIYPWNTGSDTIVVQSDGPVASRWELKTVVRAWDAAAVLKVHQGRCSDFPTEHCVKVKQYNDDAVGALAGYAVGAPTSTTTDKVVLVYLNKAYWSWKSVDSHAVTCHELGHAVGFTHDERSGCTSEDNRETPSAWELAKAARVYASIK